MGTSEDYSVLIQRRPETCTDFGTSLYDFIDDATDLTIALAGITPATTSFSYDSSLFDFYGQVHLIVRISDTLDPLFFFEITITLILHAPILPSLANWHPNYPPYFLRQLDNAVVQAGETLLYVFPAYRDLNAQDILTPSIFTPETSIPDFFYFEPAFTYMTINPPLDA